MPAILGLLLLAIGIVLVLKMGLGLLGLLIVMFVAGVIGFIAEALIPGDKMPYGWVAAIGAGLVGSWTGAHLFGSFGPSVAGFAVIPAIGGAMIVVLVVTLLSRRLR